MHDDPLDEADVYIQQASLQMFKDSTPFVELSKAQTIAAVESARAQRRIAESLELLAEILDRAASEPIAIAKTWDD